MQKITDLYPLLKGFSEKNKSPYIKIDIFLEYLEQYASRKVQENPDWGKWVGNNSIQFWNELSALVEGEKCLLIEDDSGGQIYMPYFYLDMLREIYRDPDKISDLPFPSEESLGISIPDNQFKFFYLKTDLAMFLESYDTGEDANAGNDSQILKLIFPEGYGSALLLFPMMPRKFLETTMLKVRNYLRTRGNKEFVLHKLSPQFQGREKYLREILDQLIVRPMECLSSLEKSSDFLYIFWNHFCSLVKTDIKKRNEILSEEMAAIQAALIMEICNGYYRARAVKIREKEIAFRNLELRMDKPPCFFTKDEIVKFNTDKGVPLLGMYSMQELDEYIKRAITESKNKVLPEWFVIDGKNGIQWYLKKEKYLSVCVKMLVTNQPLIKKAITKRWAKMLKDFQKEPSMENDSDFEKLLGSYTDQFSPQLAAMLGDQKLLWAYEEMEQTQAVIQSSYRIFRSGKLLPMSSLYSIHRRDMLSDAKFLLPFWYSIPIISAIAAFFAKLKKKKVKKQPSESIEIEETLEGKTKTIKELHSIADMIQSELIPQGQPPKSYLDELESRWNTLIGKTSRHNLTADVQSLVRDNVRRMIRIHKSKKISRESIREAAAIIVSGTPSLHKLSNQDSLYRYIELYMAKLLLKIK